MDPHVTLSQAGANESFVNMSTIDHVSNPNDIPRRNCFGKNLTSCFCQNKPQHQWLSTSTMRIQITDNCFNSWFSSVLKLMFSALYTHAAALEIYASMKALQALTSSNSAATPVLFYGTARLILNAELLVKMKVIR